MFSFPTKFFAAVAAVVSSVALLAVPASTAIPINTTVSARATFTGDVTFYEAGLGACGIDNNDSDLIAAVGHVVFNTFPGATGDPNTNPICGKRIIANYGGKSVTVTVTDRCPICEGTDLDFTPTAFGVLADLSAGRLTGVTWDFA